MQASVVSRQAHRAPQGPGQWEQQLCGPVLQQTSPSSCTWAPGEPAEAPRPRGQAEHHFCCFVSVRASGVFCPDSRWSQEVHLMLRAASGRQDIGRGGGRCHCLHFSPLTRESYREEAEHTYGRLWKVWSRAGESSVSKEYSQGEPDTRMGKRSRRTLFLS